MPDEPRKCSFCGQPETDSLSLVGSKPQHSAAMICARCVGDAADLLRKQRLSLSDREVLRLRYRWRGHQNDGVIVDQFAASDGQEVSAATLDWSKCCKIELMPTRPLLDAPATLHVRPQDGEKAIKFWQTDVVTSGAGAPKFKDVLGIQHTVHGKAVKMFVLLNADGSIDISGCEDV